MSATLPNFQNTRILVIGDIMLDRYWDGTTNRISPEAPVPVVRVEQIEDRLGGAANVAKNAASLGCRVALCGILGKDDAGQKLKDLLNQANIEDLTFSTEDKPTITKLRVISRHQQLLRMDFEDKLTLANDSKIAQTIENSLENTDAVIISDYAKGTINDPSKLIALCKRHKIPVFVDPKGKDFSRYRGASFITPNFSELIGAVGPCSNLKTAFEKADALTREIDADAILITLSEKGMALVEKGKAPFHVPTSAQEVFDVTGAGDTVIATLCAAIASGSGATNGVRLANVAAGIVVGKLGTSSVSTSELRRVLESREKPAERGVIDIDSLLKALDTCRKNGERIVFTNGCFDLLHTGHIRYLKQAAELGDRLVVGINSDESIKRLKGSERPIIDLSGRMEVIAALECIDWVVSFSEDTPLQLIKKIMPDVLAKGGDYEAENIVGFREVNEGGGQVDILPFVSGCSTTSIVEKIKSL